MQQLSPSRRIEVAAHDLCAHDRMREATTELEQGLGAGVSPLAMGWLRRRSRRTIDGRRLGRFETTMYRVTRRLRFHEEIAYNEGP